MCRTIAQLHDGNGVTVEIAVEALDHVGIDTHTSETIVKAHAHVTHTRITKNGVTPHKRVITVTQMQFLRQLRANTNLVDVQTRITRPHSRRRMRQTRSHETFLEDIALAGEPATHDVLCNAIVRSLSAMHRLSHRSTSIGKLLASQFTRRSAISGMLVAQRPFTDRKVAIRVVMDRRRTVIQILTRSQMRTQHRHTPGGVCCVRRTSARWHRQRERNLHITASVTNQRREIVTNATHVKRSTFSQRHIAHLDETALPTDSKIIMTIAQGAIRLDVQTAHQSHFAQLRQRLQVATVHMLQHLVAALRLQRPRKLRRSLTALASPDRSFIVCGCLCIHRHMGTDERHLTHTGLNGRTVGQAKRRSFLHRFTGRTTVETRHGTKRCHDDIQTRILPEESHHVSRSMKLFDLIRRQICITINNERDNALVAMHVRDLVANDQITHLTVRSTNTVLTSEVSRHNDGVFHRPTTSSHERSTHRLRHRRCVHEIGGRHLLTIERVVAHELSLLSQHEWRTIILIRTYDRTVRVHLSTGHQITSHALVHTARCHDRIEVAIGFFAEQRHVATTSQHPRIHGRVIRRIAADALFTSPRCTEVSVDRRPITQSVRVTHTTRFGGKNGIKDLSIHAFFESALVVIRAMARIRQTTVHAIQRGRLAHTRTT